MLVKKNSERGQVALLLILMVAVLGGVAVVVADRAVVGLRTQNLDREGLIALKKAESGIETVLSGGGFEGVDSVEGTSYEASKLESGSDGFVTADVVESGDVMQINTKEATATSIGLCWSTNEIKSAIKVTRYGVDGKIAYYAYDSNSNRNNSFAIPLADTFSCPNGFDDKVEIPLDDTDSVRVLVLYQATKVGVVPIGGTLPAQVIKVSSLGKYEETGVQRRVELVKDEEKIPAVFDNVLFSKGNISP